MSFTILPGQKWSDQYEQLKFLIQQKVTGLPTYTSINTWFKGFQREHFLLVLGFGTR